MKNKYRIVVTTYLDGHVEYKPQVFIPSKDVFLRLLFKGNWEKLPMDYGKIPYCPDNVSKDDPRWIAYNKYWKGIEAAYDAINQNVRSQKAKTVVNIEIIPVDPQQ